MPLDFDSFFSQLPWPRKYCIPLSWDYIQLNELLKILFCLTFKT